MSEEVLIRCENVGKKFCRDLKKSLWYGVKDSVADLFKCRKSRRATADSLSSQNSEGKTPELRLGEFWATKDVNFELKRGESLGLIGHNGAGKTTLLKMLNGLIKPDAGHIESRGQVGALIALGAGFNPLLTGRENVFINSLILGRSHHQTARDLDQIIAFSELENAIDAPIRTYSSGMQVRLGFAIAAQTSPDILLVDEVLAVGDNAFQKKCYDRIYEMRENGTSFIVVSHNPYQLERLCDFVAAMSKGRILKLAAPKDAIHLYHTELRSHSPIKPMEVEEYREGTGQARVQRVTLVDENESVTNEVATGSPFAFHAAIRFKEQMTGIRVRFTIYSESNALVANMGSNTITEDWKFATGTSVVKFCVEQCNLLTGVYTVEIVVVSTRGDRIDRINEAIAFSVVTRDPKIIDQSANCGIIHIAGQWYGKTPNSSQSQIQP